MSAGDGDMPIGSSGLPKLHDDASSEGETELVSRYPSMMPVQSLRPVVTVLTGFDAGRVVRIEEGAKFTVGRGSDCTLELPDPGISRHHMQVRQEGSDFICEDMGSKNGIFFDGEQFGRRKLAPGDIIQVGPQVTVRFSMITDNEERLAHNLYKSSMKDPLTWAYNRRYFHSRLQAELAFTAREGPVVSVVVFDLDHFRQINEN